MTTPNPTAGAAPTGNSAGAQTRQQAGIVLPETSSKGGSKYGLGTASSMPVNVGSLLPVIVNGKAIPPSADGTYTAEQVMAAYATASPGTIAQIQHQLILGGFYPDTYTPNYGVINAADIDAMAKATTTAAQTGGDLTEYLARQAKFGEYQGVAAAVAGQGKPRSVQKADPLALQVMIEKEFQNLTGRKATSSEKAGFIAAYNTAFRSFQDAQYDAANPATPAAVDNSGYNTAPVQAFDPRVVGVDRAEALNAQVDQSNLMAEPQVPVGATPGVSEVTDFDPAAFAEEYVKSHAGAETGAHDLTSTFSQFLSLIGGGIK